MAHARLLGAREFEKQLKHRNDQRMAIDERHRTGGQIRGAARQAKRQPTLAVSFKRRQPQVMGVF
ncbi:hypothetical protein D3C71_2206580 [compost metagenome]